MMRSHGEATDADGVTHYVRGELRYVKRAGRRRKRGKGGHYETRDGCRWWCTNARIQEGSRAHPGKPVDCMACIADPPQAPVRSYAGTTTRRMSYTGTTTGRMSSATPNRTVMMSTPSGQRLVSVFEAGVHRTIKMGARGGRRR